MAAAMRDMMVAYEPDRIRMARSPVATGWIPVAADVSLNFPFHLGEHFESTILIMRYIEFITLPLTFLAVPVVLFNAANAIVRLFQNNKNSK
jgi:hypothetical protein